MADLDTQSTAARIRTAALDLFAVRGFGGTSMRELADRVGISPAALYYHFPSKDQLVESVVAPYLDAVDALLAGDRDRPDGARPLLGAYLDVLLGHLTVARLLERDLALRDRPRIGSRHEAQLTELRTRLAPPGDPWGHVRATACLSALRGPVIRLEEDLTGARSLLLGGAARILGQG